MTGELLPGLVGFVLGGGLAGSVAALAKLRPQRDAIVIDNILRGLEVANARATAAEQRVAELQEEIRALRARLRTLEALAAYGQHRNKKGP